MRVTKLEEKCGPCTKKEQEAEWARKEQEMLRKRKEQQAEQEKREKELQRLRNLSDEDFEKEMKEVEEKVLGKPKVSVRDIREGKATPRAFWAAKDKENSSGL